MKVQMNQHEQISRKFKIKQSCNGADILHRRWGKRVDMNRAQIKRVLHSLLMERNVNMSWTKLLERQCIKPQQQWTTECNPNNDYI